MKIEDFDADKVLQEFFFGETKTDSYKHVVDMLVSASKHLHSVTEPQEQKYYKSPFKYPTWVTSTEICPFLEEGKDYKVVGYEGDCYILDGGDVVHKSFFHKVTHDDVRYTGGTNSETEDDSFDGLVCRTPHRGTWLSLDTLSPQQWDYFKQNFDGVWYLDGGAVCLTEKPFWTYHEIYRVSFNDIFIKES
jgi:hypothetical protein